jgi:hypothetical protein
MILVINDYIFKTYEVFFTFLDITLPNFIYFKIKKIMINQKKENIKIGWIRV